MWLAECSVCSVCFAEEDEEEEEGATKMDITDKTESKALSLRRTIYLTIMSRYIHSYSFILPLPPSLFVWLVLHMCLCSFFLPPSLPPSLPLSLSLPRCSVSYEECAHKLLNRKEEGQEVSFPTPD